MAEILHPCMDTDVFYVDSDDTRTYLRLKPGEDGGLIKGPDGLAIRQQHEHYEYNVPVPDPLLSGISGPADFALTSWISLGTVTNPSSTSNAFIRLTTEADLLLVPNGAAASHCTFKTFASVDGGVILNPFCTQVTENRTVDLGGFGIYPGAYSAQWPVQWAVPPDFEADLAVVFVHSILSGAGSVYAQATHLWARAEVFVQ